MEYEIFLYILVFIGLLGLSAFFSGSETAFFALSKSDIEKLKHSTDKAELRVANLLLDSRQLLVTIVVGNTIVNISTASLAAVLTTQIAHQFGFNHNIALFVDIVVVTLVLLITSEIIPKVIAVRNPHTYSRIAGAPLQLLHYMFFPITIFLTNLSKFVQNSLGLSADKTRLSEDELKTLVLLGEEEGRLEADEKEMIHSIFEFGETTVREIMVPRTDMVCVEVNATLDEVLEDIKDNLLSRIPVFEGRIDNVIGILYVKDLLPLLKKNRSDSFNLRTIVREAYFVPEQKMIDDLLRHFQKERIHMALVVDEYGGISGLVTLEDVIEEIVGEIQDEYDEEEPLITPVNDETYIVDGRLNLEELNDELHLNLPTEEGVETISGFILNLIGALPQENETIKYNGHEFTVEMIDRNRILKVRIARNNTDTDVENEKID
ncbi:MAG: HlyC/CorC family transporter [Calditrichaeota bacterium]|nr:HlyC/CorC family transporter [Calditrichota bacterium]MCB0267449.1 HlyC/CorC family transporter [Calditrichota bacterium]